MPDYDNMHTATGGKPLDIRSDAQKKPSKTSEWGVKGSNESSEGPATISGHGLY